MTRRRLSVTILLALTLVLIGQVVVYAQGETKTANTSAPLSTSLQIDGLV